MDETIVDLIRHGEPQGGSLYRGHNIDDPLSEKGWAQMWAAIGDHAIWDKIISSPLLRCSDFSRALSEKINKPVLLETQFREVGFGSWEGKSRAQVKQDNQQEYDAFYRDPVKNRPHAAEPLNDFIGRVAGAYDEVVKRNTNQHILIVAHAGVIRAVIAHVLRASPIGLYRIKIDNAGLCRISHNQYGAAVEFINGKLT